MIPNHGTYLRAAALVLAALSATACRLSVDDDGRTIGRADAWAAGAPAPAMERSPYLSGRVTTDDGTVYQGRLRWGGDEEALWSNYFNGAKDANPWAAHLPPELRPRQRLTLEVFGRELAGWNRRTDLARPFMARFGDIARIDARDRDLRVVLRSGTTFDLDRYGADDLADGLRVWDPDHGVVDIGEWSIRTIEFLPVDAGGPGGRPLFGTVRTAQGAFTGLLQWDREACLTSDDLVGRQGGRELRVSFGDVRTIARRSDDSALVTLTDGREVVLTAPAGRGNRGIYVDDPRYGRVLVSWDAFESLALAPAPEGPGYGDYAAGRPLRGAVSTRSGRRLVGRLVYDLDESETTETLDAPRQGVDYTIPFDRIASILPWAPDEHGADHARVLLRDGQDLHLERSGDLGDGNAGLLVFEAGADAAAFVSWSDVERIDLDPSS